MRVKSHGIAVDVCGLHLKELDKSNSFFIIRELDESNPLFCYKGVAQLVEQWSPKPCVMGSIPITLAN